jgi:hypothetical protein
MEPWIGVDLDGTLAEYHGWKSETYIGKPIPAMVERVEKWLEEGKRVKIFTARVAGVREEPVGIVREAIWQWLAKHIKNYQLIDDVTNEKDYGLEILYDDRCVQVEVNTGRLLSELPAKDWERQ